MTLLEEWTKSIQRLKVRRALISLSVAALMASIAAVLGFVFAVQPVWSTSAQMQAEREGQYVRLYRPRRPVSNSGFGHVGRGRRGLYGQLR